MTPATPPGARGARRRYGPSTESSGVGRLGRRDGDGQASPDRRRSPSHPALARLCFGGTCTGFIRSSVGSRIKCCLGTAISSICGQPLLVAVVSTLASDACNAQEPSSLWGLPSLREPSVASNRHRDESRWGARNFQVTGPPPITATYEDRARIGRCVRPTAAGMWQLPDSSGTYRAWLHPRCGYRRRQRTSVLMARVPAISGSW